MGGSRIEPTVLTGAIQQGSKYTAREEVAQQVHGERLRRAVRLADVLRGVRRSLEDRTKARGDQGVRQAECEASRAGSHLRGVGRVLQRLELLDAADQRR